MSTTREPLDAAVDTNWRPTDALGLLEDHEGDLASALQALALALHHGDRRLRELADYRRHIGQAPGLTETIQAHRALRVEIDRRRELVLAVARAKGIKGA